MATKRPYKPLAKQKRPSTSAAKKPGPRVMTPEVKKRALKIVRLSPKADAPQPPKDPRYQKGMTARAMLASRSGDTMSLGREVIIESMKRQRTGKGLPAVVAKCWHNDPLRPGAVKRVHEVMVFGRDDPNKPISQQPIFVSCDCEDWCFRWEYAATVHGASKILYGNGEKPFMTNPQEIPGCCKHVSPVLEHIVRKGL